MATAKTARPARKSAATTSSRVAAAPAKTPSRTSASASAKTPVKLVASGAKPQATPSTAVKTVNVKPATGKADKKKDKPEKVKVLRDSFTIPKTEFANIAGLKKRAMTLGHEVKKSELIRAGLLLLAAQNDAALLKALTAVPALKTGRPGKA